MSNLVKFMLIVSLVAVLLPIWIWAIFGMSEEVGTASFVTGLMLFLMTFIVAISEDLKS